MFPSLAAPFFFILLGLSNACVFITVSSLPGRKIELNWSCNDTVDTVSLHRKDPEGLEDSQILVNVSVADHPDGYYRTEIEFDPEPFPGGWSYDNEDSEDGEDEENDENSSGSFCLYWVSASGDGRLVHKNCLSIEPAWMSEYRSELRHMSLPMLFLPGTHNSGCDRMKLGRERRGSKIDSFVLTQDQSIWNQLVYGIRFLDLRIGHYPQTKKEKQELRFWINHDLLGVQPLIPVLRDIKRFVKSSPDEIIILDFHRFPVGFKRKKGTPIHRDLIDLIATELWEYILPRPEKASELTLGEIWKSDKRIIVSYNDEQSLRADLVRTWVPSGSRANRNRIKICVTMLSDLNKINFPLCQIATSRSRLGLLVYVHKNGDWDVRGATLANDVTPWLWNPVIQKWGNKQTPSQLEKFLNDSFLTPMPNSRLWAAMAELTPTPLDFLNNSSLRTMADSVNRLLSIWFSERLDWAEKANIVATDFFLGNNLVERAIEENLRRAQESQ